ncbi:type II toxin-antitoxin system RelB/DinJ family antitoxin [Sporolactobacillus sp. STSJ-5]|uniref:type II toxin-antitoxin system RelB/DinJ family antitoxin n=1 Tax=Sporolactobacillus sp. STSJ-5 TaxID=2965076 RepID=UPI002103B811|nr:type II toxin-antitoxin system RelB/DinJ family antitoxin [Sporolactobacillus sp. STSJ-5]MCQ2010524.1 type II toxin-antitoxin system RelB/DinJ family antitoxin [Sporolactobacillus sp. STSJ-5]
MAERIMLGTTVDSELKKQFKKKCDEIGLTMSEALDAILKAVISGNIILDKHITAEQKDQ